MEKEHQPEFNLWTQPWIDVQFLRGQIGKASISEVLLHAHEIHAIIDPSPLAIAGILRLLIAVLQDALKPERVPDIKNLYQAGCFPEKQIQAFGEKYSGRFDIFSSEAPFMQSRDLPVNPGRGDPAKTIAYLTPDRPSGTNITHFHHIKDSDNSLCPACCAKGLVIVPCFATAGGKGIKPSINGVPPIYVFPSGNNLFQSLTLSLTTPAYQPRAASRSDLPWWLREPVVGKSEEVIEVGYLHSLTFPARRIRLHPKRVSHPCTRCAETAEWQAGTMVYEMGEFRDKESAFWFDPFAAYRLPGRKAEKPTPIRPLEGKAIWREFTSLFLTVSEDQAAGNYFQRPRIIDQISDLRISLDSVSFRVIGIRTDMKAKIFEWIDAEFDVPSSLLDDPQAGFLIQEAVRSATDFASSISSAFKQTFNPKRTKSERNKDLREKMLADYWSSLAEDFRLFVLKLGYTNDREKEFSQWVDTALQLAEYTFSRYIDMTAESGKSLRTAVEGRQLCRRFLYHTKKSYVRSKGESE